MLDEDGQFTLARFDDDRNFACDHESMRNVVCFWQECEPLRKHFTIPKE